MLESSGGNGKPSHFVGAHLSQPPQLSSLGSLAFYCVQTSLPGLPPIPTHSGSEALGIYDEPHVPVKPRGQSQEMGQYLGLPTIRNLGVVGHRDGWVQE